jgi:hypothetical protein
MRARHTAGSIQPQSFLDHRFAEFRVDLLARPEAEQVDSRISVFVK